jgi:dUTP pyrophosphatase
LQKINVFIKKLPQARDLPLPEYMSANASGVDLLAAIEEDISISPGDRKLIPAGISLALPSGFEGQIRPRSGLALKYGLTVLNSPGTIDADYRGEIKVILINLGPEAYKIRRGERIAQLVIQALPEVILTEVEELPATERGEGGFGHTGKF